jgi:hypothetical protein
MLTGLFRLLRAKPTTLGNIAPACTPQPVYGLDDPRHPFNRGWTRQPDNSMRPVRFVFQQRTAPQTTTPMVWPCEVQATAQQSSRTATERPSRRLPWRFNGTGAPHITA